MESLCPHVLQAAQTLPETPNKVVLSRRAHLMLDNEMRIIKSRRELTSLNSMGSVEKLTLRCQHVNQPLAAMAQSQSLHAKLHALLALLFRQ